MFAAMYRGLVDRIRSRKLVQWAFAYAAAAWLVIQVLDVLADPWGLPAWAIRTAQILLGIGLLVTLVLAWYHGEKGRQRASGPELILIAALLLTGGMLVSLVGREGANGEADATAVDRESGTAPADIAIRRRIAVLPLENLTGDPEQDHIVAGLYEAIAFGLGSIRSLEVISTTSAETYRGTGQRAPEIARELGVGSLLSGSVRAQADSVRITLNLIDAERDTREWTGRFEGGLSDVMRLEDDIARDVARQLRAHLTPREDSLLATSQRIDPRAGDLYLRARTAPTRAEAITLLEEAIRVDPGFAAPYGELARRYGEQAFGGTGSVTSDELYDRVVQLANRGLQIDSTLASALTALAEVKFHRDWEYDAGLRLFQQALDINPSYATAYMRISAHQAALGNADESIAAARMAQKVDPRSSFPWYGLAESLCSLGRFEEALQEADVAMRIAPGNRWALAARGSALIRLGRFEEGLADLEQSRDSVGLAIGLALAGRSAEAIAIRDEVADPARAEPVGLLGLARVYAATGDTDRAISLLERAAEERAGALMWLSVDPDLDAVRADPRGRALLDRVRFPAAK